MDANEAAFYGFVDRQTARSTWFASTTITGLIPFSQALSKYKIGHC
jgi:hypothetical protein